MFPLPVQEASPVSSKTQETARAMTVGILTLYGGTFVHGGFSGLATSTGAVGCGTTQRAWL